jgi:O-antigen/teichoic acid export membrane protein
VTTTDTWLRQVTGSWRAPDQYAPPPPPPREPEPEPERKSSPLSALTGIWHKHADLLHNAASLAATTGVTSILGFAFWTFAARYFSQTAVGYGSAGISAMTLLGTVGMFGLGTVLIGELPQRRSRGGLVASSLIASGVGSAILGIAFCVAAPHFSTKFVEITGSPGRMLLFAVGVALTGATLVFDEATIGLLRGGLQLSRNLTFSIVKMAALPVGAFVLHDAFGVGIILAWVLGTMISVIPTAIQLRHGGTNIFPRPDWGVLRGLGRTTMAHNWLNLAIGVPATLIPVLVTVVVSPAANGAFYVAWMLSSFLFVVPTHLSTVLYAVASAAPQIIAQKLRFVLRLSVLIGVPAMAVLWFGAHLALSVFGKRYAADATWPLRLLILGYLPALPKTQYIAVCRAAGRVTRAAVILTISSVAQMAAVVVGGLHGGLIGLTVGLLVVGILEGLVTAPAVFRTAMNRGGRHRRGMEATAAPASARAADDHSIVAPRRPATRQFPTVVPVTSPQRIVRAQGPQPRFIPIEELRAAQEKARERERRQEVGLAVLMSLATTDPFRIPSRAHQAGPTFSFGPAEQLDDDTPPPELPQPRREPPRRRKPPVDMWADKV